MSQVDTVISVAAKEIGVHEVGGNNRGKRVEEYLATVGLSPGDPWCAAFVAWVLQQAGFEIGGDGWPRTGFCPYIEDWGIKRKCYSRTPKRGDVFLLLDSQGPFHTGFVSGVNSDGTIETIEGNTNGGGSADGDGVFRRRRVASGCSFVRYDDVLRAKSATRLVKIFRKPERAVIVIDGQEYPIKSMSIDGAAPAAGTSTAIVCEY